MLDGLCYIFVLVSEIGIASFPDSASLRDLNKYVCT
jgi:hypothetical protein